MQRSKQRLEDVCKLWSYETTESILKELMFGHFSYFRILRVYQPFKKMFIKKLNFQQAKTTQSTTIPPELPLDTTEVPILPTEGMQFLKSGS